MMIRGGAGAKTLSDLDANALCDAFDALDEGVALFDASRTLVFYNERFGEFYRAGPAPLEEGLAWRAFFGRAAVAGIAQGLEQVDAALKAGPLRPITVEAPRPGERVVRIRLRPTRGGGFVLTEADVTDERAGEELRAEADSVMREVLDACSTSIFMSRIDDGAMLYQTPHSRDLFGTIADARTTYLNTIDRARYVAELLPTGAIDDYQVRLKGRGGRIFPANVSGRLVEYRGEEVIVSSILDMTVSHAQREEIVRLNQRLLDAIESLSEAFVLYDGEDRLVMANRLFREVNAPIEDVIVPGTSHSAVIAAAERAGLFRNMEEVRERFGEAFDGTGAGWREKRQVEIEHINGRVYLAASAPTDEGGVVLTWRDITERRRAEAVMRERIADAIEALAEGFCLLDANFIVRLANRAFVAHVLPHRLEEGADGAIVGLKAADLAREALEHGVFRLPEGMTRAAWVERYLAAIRDLSFPDAAERSDGRMLETAAHQTALGGWLLITRDVTEDRRAEEAEREADELVRTIVASSPTTFLVSRVSDGHIVYISPASRERFGNITSSLAFFLDPAVRTRYLEALLPTGQLDNYRVRFRRRDGSIMDGLTSARVAEYKGEAIIVSSTRDISDQLRMEAELARQREIAHQNEKLSALGELLAGVAHELNNPLSVIIGQALMLREDLTDARNLARIERLSKAADRSAKIVRTFLAMARHEPAALAEVPLNLMVETAIDVVRPVLEERGVDLTIALDPDEPLVCADEDQITQVVINLLTNAEQAMRGRPKRALAVVTAADPARPGRVLVSVADSGPGVPDAIKKRIFEPLFTTKDVGEGTGIGLALSHRIVVSHGGEITVGDAAGGGAVFHVGLPRRERSGEAGS